jgi:hypothetical protein
LSTNLARGLPTVEASTIRRIRRKQRQRKKETVFGLLGTYVLLLIANRSELIRLNRGRRKSHPSNSANADGAVWREYKSIRIQPNTSQDQDEDGRDCLQIVRTARADLVEWLTPGLLKSSYTAIVDYATTNEDKSTGSWERPLGVSERSWEIACRSRIGLG